MRRVDKKLFFCYNICKIRKYVQKKRGTIGSMKIRVGEHTFEPVQFKRGTQEMYDRMLAAGEIDPHTFYLIVDDNSLNFGDRKVLTQKKE